MPCRVGTTTDPEERKEYWESQVEGFKDSTWDEYGPYSSREDAQSKENELIQAYGCEGHHGGDNPDDENKNWYAYRFDYTREK